MNLLIGTCADIALFINLACISKSLGAASQQHLLPLSLCRILVILINSHFFIIIIFVRESVIRDLDAHLYLFSIYFSHQVLLNEVDIVFYI